MDKTTKEFYKTELVKYWNNNLHMIEYDLKKVDIIATIRGYLFPIDKQNIKKRFCFGYDFDDTDARAQAQNARTNQQYFIDENLRDLKEYQKYFTTDKPVLFVYNDKSKIGNLFFSSNVNLPQHIHDIVARGNKCFLLNDDEKAQLINAYQNAIDNFTKRINTYLKKYGLNHVVAWSYWRD